MPQLFPSQWIILVNMSFLMIFLIFSMFNFKMSYSVSKKTKVINNKSWKW